MHDLAGKVAVITGAGSGLGREFAVAAAGRGMSVVLADVQDDALAGTLSEIERMGAPAVARRVDVSQSSEVEALAKDSLSKFGAVHLLFNNAGVAGGGGLVWETSETDWRWTLGVNLWGVVHGIRHFTPLMLEAARSDARYRGRIINSASMAGLVSAPLMGTYSATKHAVVSVSETLYHDLALVTDQVSCSVLCPFFVPTGIARSDRNRPKELVDERPPTNAQVIAHQMNVHAVEHSKVSASEVARMVFDAIGEDRFYIYSHPQAMSAVERRMQDIICQRNPTDPLADRPDFRRKMAQAIGF
ncbi:hypothetical protein XH83_21015 [Bradyrhizobium sp. CCBAU 53351]|nr:hypothetical protein XH83_21015 [Bradyrhizobium sp. CCBAU 53351]